MANKKEEIKEVKKPETKKKVTKKEEKDEKINALLNA